MKTYHDETIELAIMRSENLASKFVEEVRRLIKTGALRDSDYSRGEVFSVALENIAECFLTKGIKTSSYKNLKRF